MDSVKAPAFKIFRFGVHLVSGSNIGKFKPVNRVFQWIYRRLIPCSTQIVDVNGYKMKLEIGPHRQVGGIDELLMSGQTYEPMTTRVFEEYARHDGITVDIGANIGYFTLLGSLYSRKVIGIEPESRNFTELQNNVLLNEFNNVHLLQMAVTSKNGFSRLEVSDTETGEHSLIAHKSRKYSRHETVKTITLDSIFHRETLPVKLVKIDTEGNEIEVLKGLKKSNTNGTALIIEVWPEGLQNAGHSLNELFTWLNRLGFRNTWLIDEHKMTVTLCGIEEVRKYIKRHGFSVNMLCLKGDEK